MTDKNASGVKIPDDLVQVGFIAGAYGVAGWVRIRPFSEEADALRKVKTWWLDKPLLRAIEVQQVKLHSGDVVALLAGVAGRDAAEALKGTGIFIPQSQFPVLSADEFYWSDLIGLEVENLQGEHLGKVTDMMSNGPQSILRVMPVAAADANPEEAAQERLIPFVDAFINKVDKEANKIIVDWGLDY